MPTETLADAINSALEEVTPHGDEDTTVTPDEDVVAPEGDDAPAGDQDDDGAGDDAGEDGADGEGGDADGAEPPQQTSAELAAEADKLGISKHRADGSFKSKAELAAEVSAAKAGAGKDGQQPTGKDQAKKPAEVKKPDPVNDPIDKTLKPATQERIRTLIGMAKEADGRAEKAVQDFNYLVQGVQATGASPEQYGETLSWLALFNSSKHEDQVKALELIEITADRLATMLGVERQVSDPLKQHPDLQQAIQAGKITREFAQEMARNRNQGQLRTQLTTAATEAEQRAAEAAKEVTDAKAGLNDLENQLRQTDPLYEQKKEAILPTLKALFPSIRPSMWKDAFSKAYREVKLQVGVARTPMKKVPNNQPMRAGRTPGGGGGGNMTPAAGEGPKSALDAVNAALSRMGK